ncbi:MAG: glycosyltransferase family 4 protein [Promethearchaeota archaeon]
MSSEKSNPMDATRQRAVGGCRPDGNSDEEASREGRVDCTVLHVIHGFPPNYMAGSEVYTLKLCREQAKFLRVVVFSRDEDPYSEPYSVKHEKSEGIEVYRVVKNQRDYLFEDKYLDERMDELFRKILEEVKPDIVHVGHLSHLSTNIVHVIKKEDIPVVFTLHDFWMMCLRGQLITPEKELCNGPSPAKCSRCTGYYFRSFEEGVERYTKWEAHIRGVLDSVDRFIAPSRFLREKFIEFGVPAKKISYQDYGFDLSPFRAFGGDLEVSQKIQDGPVTGKVRFGFMGRIIPVKGVDILVEALNRLDPRRAHLVIFGNSNGHEMHLRKRIKNQDSVEFKGSYHNDEITGVFKEIDVLVVPSIWYENSPLVIHEAFLAKKPVITTNIGGMSELVKDGENGLLFEVGNVDSLAEAMQRFVDDPSLTRRLNKTLTQVRSIEEDALGILKIYDGLLNRRENE